MEEKPTVQIMELAEIQILILLYQMQLRPMPALETCKPAVQPYESMKWLSTRLTE